MDRINPVTAAAGVKYTSALLLWLQTAPYQRAEIQQCAGAPSQQQGVPQPPSPARNCNLVGVRTPPGWPSVSHAQCGDLEL